jgi:hypothetical protein
MSGFGKTTIFNGLIGNLPNVFCWASDYLIWSSFWSPEEDISRIWRLGDRPFQALIFYITYSEDKGRQFGLKITQKK